MDEIEFTEAVIEAEPTLYHVALSMLRDEQSCADATQQAILNAWEHLPSLRHSCYFKTWLVRILINECTAILRQRKRFADYDPEAAEAIPAPVPDEHSDLHAAIRSLEEKYRLPVVLYYMEGFKTREIASMLDVPEGTVKSRLKTARGLLRDTLEGACLA